MVSQLSRFECMRSRDRLLHKLQGLELARLADLPEDVLIEAQRVADNLTQLKEREERESQTNKIAVRRKALLRVTFLPCLQCLSHCCIEFGGLMLTSSFSLHQLKTQLKQVYEYSTLPRRELVAYLGNLQKDVAQVLNDTL